MNERQTAEADAIMKETFDVFENSKGVRSWRHGIFEDNHRLVYGSAKPFPSDEYAIVETPSCFLRVSKKDIDKETYIAHIRSYFAVYRVNPAPRYPNVVQWSTKRGRWVNDRAFDTAEEAMAYVSKMNARLIPYSNSPYIVQEIKAD